MSAAKSAGMQEHHRKRAVEEEYIALLRKHGIAFDERYPWD